MLRTQVTKEPKLRRALLCGIAILLASNLSFADTAKGEAAIEAKDYRTALNEFRKTPTDPLAMAWMGYLYQEGLGVQKNEKTAFSWLNKAAKAGDPWGAHRLSDYFANGIATKQDLVAAFQWKSIAVEQGYTAAMADLGRMYRYGRGVEKDPIKALALYEQGVTAENLDCADELGHELFSGEITNKDYLKSRELLTKAFDAGYNNRTAFELGYMHANGLGGKADLQQAFKYYSIAAENGSVGAQNNLGVMYEKGTGVVLDSNAALRWYKKAADNGYQLGKSNFDKLSANLEKQRVAYLNEQAESARIEQQKRVIGTLLCHSSVVELSDFQGLYSNGRPLYRNVEGKSYLTAFVEGSMGTKIQLRLASVKATYLGGSKSGQTVTLDKMDSPMWGTIYPGSIFWTDDYYWARC